MIPFLRLPLIWVTTILIIADIKPPLKMSSNSCLLGTFKHLLLKQTQTLSINIDTKSLLAHLLKLFLPCCFEALHGKMTHFSMLTHYWLVCDHDSNGTGNWKQSYPLWLKHYILRYVTLEPVGNLGMFGLVWYSCLLWGATRVVGCHSGLVMVTHYLW